MMFSLPISAGERGMSLTGGVVKWQYRREKRLKQDVTSVVPTYGSSICPAWLNASAESTILATEFAESAEHTMVRSSLR